MQLFADLPSRWLTARKYRRKQQLVCAAASQPPAPRAFAAIADR